MIKSKINIKTGFIKKHCGITNCYGINQILKKIQDIFNLIPNLSNAELAQAFLTKSNDMHLIIYLSSLVRSVIALHDLVNNKIKYKDIDELEDKQAAKEERKQAGEDSGDKETKKDEKEKA